MPAIIPRILDSATKRYQIEMLALGELSATAVAQWRNLAQRAMEPNPFCDPDFVIPLVTHFDLHRVALLVVRDQCQQWQFAAPVIQHYLEEGSPLPELRTLRSPYSFLDQPLVGRDDPVMTLTCLFDALSRQREWHGMGCGKVRCDSEQFELIEFSAKVCGMDFQTVQKNSRPSAIPRSREELLQRCSSNRRKSLRKTWKKLTASGKVEYRLIRPEADEMETIETFLWLESTGWKGNQGTAVTCQQEDRQFFISMCQNFAREQKLYFGELLLNDRVIASTCNLQAGKVLFAFKIGWDAACTEFGLGYWSELLLADAVFREAPFIELIDSCSHEDSYTGSVWPERIEVSHALLLWSRRARLAQGAKSIVKAIVNR